ncbi:MAG: hypothetical protein QM704_04440 [Anaeromyxobacteraceae bacterium]
MPVTQAQVRAVARALDGVTASREGFSFSVKRGAKDVGIAWAWRERIHPRKARVPSTEVMAVRVADLEEKESLLALDPGKYFTEPHYDGYPAVLVRLGAVTRAEVRRLLLEAVRAALPVKPARKVTARPARRKRAARDR